ncbi:MAG: InlB B-repeat-containing protein [Treponema sp.]|uniref:InlB B-repeat-containing protein n=1 Tax=Treponema sp. TaxID=166 RepID=UPI003FA2F875
MKKIAVLLLLVLAITGCFPPNNPVKEQDNSTKNNKPTYTITFNGNGGATPDNKETYTQTLPKDVVKHLAKNTFIRNGYIFKGWSELKEAVESTVDDEAEYSASKDITLYAIWKLIPATLVGIHAELLSNTPCYMYDAFDKAVLKVTATMSDGTLLNISDYTTDFEIVTLSAGIDKPVTVKYQDKTAMFKINVLYKFCETIIHLPKGTDGTAGTSGSYLYFGDYPQTIKNDSVTINGSPTNINGWTVYLGSDNYYYVKCHENAFWTDYKYSDGTTVKRFADNSERYFKMEPIQWSIVTDSYYDTGDALVVAEKALMANVPYYINFSNRIINTKTVYPNNYMYSSIRAFLNGRYELNDTQPNNYEGKGFLQTAFSKKAQDSIPITSVVNNGFSAGVDTTHSPSLEYFCANTNDKIFLLSYVDAELLKTDNRRTRISTDYAKANYAECATIYFNGSEYWLRSPQERIGFDDFKIQSVLWHGRINKPGRKLDTAETAIVPAMTVHL